MDHPHSERRPPAVRRHLDRLDVGVAVDLRLEPAPAVADRPENEHPAALESKFGALAGVLDERVENPDAEDDQRHPDDPAHDRIDPVRQDRPEEQGRQAEHQDHRGVTECVQRPEQDRPRLLRDEPAAIEGERLGYGYGHRRRARHVSLAVANPQVAVRSDPFVRSELAGAAVLVDVAARRAMFGLVASLAGGRRCGRARDVGNRGDVVPVDAVSEPEQERGHQEADTAAGGDGERGADDEGEIGHGPMAP